MISGEKLVICLVICGAIVEQNLLSISYFQSIYIFFFIQNLLIEIHHYFNSFSFLFFDFKTLFSQMVKADVDHRFDSKEDLELLLQTWWKSETIKSFHKLRGGYSGTNYYILTNSSKEAVMKICHGYTLPEVESQFKIPFYLFDNGYDYSCRPFKLLNANPESYFTTLTDDKQPVVLMNFLPGNAGDVVIDSAVVEKSKALEEIGYFLGMMHNTPLKGSQKVRNFVDEGICLLGKHIRGEFANLFKNHSEEYITNHPYVKFYFDHYALFLSTIAKCQSFRQSVIHGDAFLDNIILDSVDGHLL